MSSSFDIIKEGGVVTFRNCHSCSEEKLVQDVS